MMVARAMLLSGFVLVLAWAGLASAEPPSALETTLRRELDLLRDKHLVDRSTLALARERQALGLQLDVLAHVSGESLRRLDAYTSVRDHRERHARARARSLASLARGGIARLVFDDHATSGTEDRLALGRTLRWVVRHDLHQLAAHRRAERRAGTEQLAAARERQAMDALVLVHALQSQALTQADASLSRSLATATLERRRLQTQADPSAQRDLAELLRGAEQFHAAGSPGADALELLRPVPGHVVAGFGVSDDAVLGVPVARNGVELAAARDQVVRAPADGTVVHVGALPGFETVVVIDHGGDRLTLLGRLWRAEVEQGDRVAARDPIAHVAEKSVDDGLGRTVYLELREGGRAIDPGPHLAAVVEPRAEPANPHAALEQLLDAPAAAAQELDVGE